MLLGTQMVAKGHDFPDVTLGVVLDADATLRFPDFRAEERTFALIAQLAGPRRARARAAGACSCRRSPPRRASIRHAARHDSDGFLAGELERREALALSALRAARSASSAPRRAPGRGAQAARGGRARGSRRAGADVLGPAPLFRLRGRERAQVVVKAADGAGGGAGGRRGGGAAPRATASTASATFSVDVDPQ